MSSLCPLCKGEHSLSQCPRWKLTVAGNPDNPKFADVYVGPPAFTEVVRLRAGTRLYIMEDGCPST